MNLLSDADHARVSAAISAYEADTAGEIYCVMTRRCVPAILPPLFWAGIAAMTAPLIWLVAGLPGLPLVMQLTGRWSSTHSPAMFPDMLPLWGLALLPLLSFVLVFSALHLLGRLRPRLLPRAWRRHMVHRAALNQFKACGIRQTAGRTGVLIFLSLEDHMAEIVADSAIYAKVPPNAWGTALDALVAEARAGRHADAFIAAIGHAGALLAAHFPPLAANPNELPDRLVEIA